MFVPAVLAAVISLLSWQRRALTGNGAVAAFVVGFLVFTGTGWSGAAALISFFISSTLVSRLAERHEPAWLDAPGNRRNALQVLANGGPAAVGGALGLAGWTDAGFALVSASLAAAAADTWATSFGMSSRGDPLDIWRRTRVPKGTSGGISVRGTLGGLGGATVVAASPIAVGGEVSFFPMALACGIAGMLLDSLLGATLQGRFHCPACNQASERRVHRCGTATKRVKGWAGLSNDGVNLVATSVAGLVGLALL